MYSVMQCKQVSDGKSRERKEEFVMYVNLRLDDAEIEKSMERIKSLMDEAQQEFMRLRSRVGFVAEPIMTQKESADSPN